MQLRRCHDRLEQLEREMDEATKDGMPEEAIKRIDDETAAFAQQEAAWAAERRGLEAERQRYQKVLDNLEASNFDSGCPTCGRAFTADDAATSAELFRTEIERLHARMQEGDRASGGLRQRLEVLARERAAAEERRKHLEQVRAALVKGRGITDEQERATAQAAADLATILRQSGLEAPPTEQDLTHAEQAETLARAIGGTLDRLRLHLKAVEDAAVDMGATEAEIATFGEIAYDADAHERAIKARDEAQKAQTSVLGFDRELSQEPVAIEERDRLASRISELEQAHGEAKQRLFDVGFDPEMLQVAETALELAEASERAAQTAIHQAELRHQRAESDLAAVQKEHEALRATLETADRLQREADDLKQMYDEFANFEKWVVARLTPTLGDLTSRIVAQVTDGRYDEVSFDENFGILVRDGDEAPFPVAQFSGGERDVIALAARLALSQLIGAQAAEQPGFLVLDEVFGSLDRDRRTRLLELLGALGEVSDRFQQVFIISHVDDVRSAPVLDDLWMVRETSPGISAITPLSPGTDIGEL
jgi:exonuclease SbcC